MHLVRLPEPWNCLLSFNIYFKKSLKVTQSPRVPRVRGGDPSGVAPGKLEGFFSASGHPWKPFSWKLGSPVHPCLNQWCLDVQISQEGSKNHPSSWSIIIFLLLIHLIIPFKHFITFFFQRFSFFLPVFRNNISLNWLRDFSLIKSVSIITWITGISRHIKKVDDSGHLPDILGREIIPDNKEDGYIYPIFLAPSKSVTTVLRYRNRHLQEPLQRPNHIQLMELRAKTIRWKIRLGGCVTPFRQAVKQRDVWGILSVTNGCFRRLDDRAIDRNHETMGGTTPKDL